MHVAWSWSWLAALPVVIWMGTWLWRGKIDIAGALLGTLLLGGLCAGIVEAVLGG